MQWLSMVSLTILSFEVKLCLLWSIVRDLMWSDLSWYLSRFCPLKKDTSIGEGWPFVYKATFQSLTTWYKIVTLQGVYSSSSTLQFLPISSDFYFLFFNGTYKTTCIWESFGVFLRSPQGSLGQVKYVYFSPNVVEIWETWSLMIARTR